MKANVKTNDEFEDLNAENTEAEAKKDFIEKLTSGINKFNEWYHSEKVTEKRAKAKKVAKGVGIGVGVAALSCVGLALATSECDDDYVEDATQDALPENTNAESADAPVWDESDGEDSASAEEPNETENVNSEEI